MLTGSARLAQEAKEAAEEAARHVTLEQRQRELEAKRREMEAQVAAIRAAYAAQEKEFEQAAVDDRRRYKQSRNERDAMARSRKVASSRAPVNGDRPGPRRKETVR
jgi:circadian clock protein KaiC